MTVFNITWTNVPLVLEWQQAEGVHLVTLKGKGPADNPKTLYQGRSLGEANAMFQKVKADYLVRKANQAQEKDEEAERLHGNV